MRLLKSQNIIHQGEKQIKKLVNVTEIESEGIIKLLGERVTFFCLNYIYVGELMGVNDTCVLLKKSCNSI